MKLWLTLTFLFVSIGAYSQSRTIRGVIMTKNGIYLPGVTINILRTTEGVITDVCGRFEIEIPKKSTLRFSLIGPYWDFETEHLKGDDSNVNFKVDLKEKGNQWKECYGVEIKGKVYRLRSLQ